MIGCKKCKRSCQTSAEEQLDNCPECMPENWRVFNVRPGARLPSNVERAVASAPYRVFGRCFLTPRGYIVPIYLMREYRASRITRAVPIAKSTQTSDEE